MDTVAVLVDGAGDEFLAGAGLAANQHADGRGGDAPDFLVDGLHGPAIANNGVACLSQLADLHRFRHEPAGRHSLLDQLQQFRHLKRLEEVVISPGLRRLDGGFRRAMRRHHQDRQPWPHRMEFTHQFQPVQSWQLQIGDHNIKDISFRTSQAGVAGFFDHHFITVIGQHASQSGHDGRIVLDKQDPKPPLLSAHRLTSTRSTSGHWPRIWPPPRLS